MAFSATRMLMAAGFTGNIPSGYVAAFFSGTSTASRITIPTTTTFDTASTGIISVWVNFTAFQTDNMIFGTTAGNIFFLRYNHTNNRAQCTIANSANTANINILTTVTLTTGTWNNIVCSWNASSSVGTMYINGSGPGSPTFSGGSFVTAFSTDTPYILGYAPSNEAGAYTNGCVSEFYFAPGQFLDFTSPTNIALFYNSGNPVNLGSNGQTPTGTAPALYWHGQYNNLSNLGTLGGSFTAAGNALTNCSSAP
jgi:hypothetical protein